jgi:hypothetical protein
MDMSLKDIPFYYWNQNTPERMTMFQMARKIKIRK